MIFKQLFDQTSGTYTYLLADEDSRQALLIDSVFEQYERDLSLIRELELNLLACLETHCHADHV
ncbi:MAG: MBL fold metallo-hydrolase, partial [Desulfofustis sp.]|nr:MBL fold metallo-hydrolase [Desulfofustis sp.]